MNGRPEDGRRSGRVWTFAKFRYEELMCQLTRDSVPVQITDKPRSVLVCLLEAEGGVVTAEELNEMVWLGDELTDQVLRTTVLALRKALGDEDKEIVKTAHRVGYRMGVRVICQVEDNFIQPNLLLKVGDRVPGRPDWILKAELDLRTPHAVWLTQHVENKRIRVYKLAEDGVRLRELQREMTLGRLFSRLAPKATCFIQVEDWQLDNLPYLLGSEFGGDSLETWAKEQWGTGGLSQSVCLSVLAEICDAVDLAHEFGIVHNDLKPSNVLVAKAGADALWHVKLTDFGIATLQDLKRFSEFDISGQGFDGDASTVAGSAMYIAPEVKPGQPPTRSADIYALGVIMFQLLSGDFRKTPVPGWEQNIDDPLLREDIALTVELNPILRLKSAAELATRLRTLGTRREAERLRQEAARVSEELRRRDQKSRVRRPYLQALFASLVVGLLSSGWFYRKAEQERQTTEEINSFLTDDLLSQMNPNIGSGADETLKQAIRGARPMIDTRFSAQPQVAARIHQSVALALDNAQDSSPAAEEYDRAAADWITVSGPMSQDALYQQYQHVRLDARSFGAGALDRARALKAREDAILQHIPRPWPRVRVVQLEADGTIAMVEGRPKDAVNRYHEAVDLAQKSPDISTNLRRTTKRVLCFGEFRAEQAVQAEQCFREEIEEAKAFGARDEQLAPEQVGLVQALRYQRRFHDVLQQINSVYPAVLKQLGPDADYPMVLLGIRAEAEAALEQWDDAIRDDLAVAEHAKKVDPKSFPAIASLSDVALSECRSGRTEAGEGHAREAVKAIDVPGGNPGFTGAIKEVLASCLIPHIPEHPANLGRLNEAERLLAGIDVAVVSGSLGDAKWGANVDLDRAQIAFYHAQYALSAKYLDAARPGFSSPEADAYQKKAVAALDAAIPH